jgi:hypothetical protein
MFSTVHLGYFWVLCWYLYVDSIELEYFSEEVKLTTLQVNSDRVP